jgi:hypothetical protein
MDEATLLIATVFYRDFIIKDKSYAKIFFSEVIIIEIRTGCWLKITLKLYFAENL